MPRSQRPRKPYRAPDWEARAQRRPTAPKPAASKPAEPKALGAGTDQPGTQVKQPSAPKSRTPKTKGRLLVPAAIGAAAGAGGGYAINRRKRSSAVVKSDAFDEAIRRRDEVFRQFDERQAQRRARRERNARIKSIGRKAAVTTALGTAATGGALYIRDRQKGRGPVTKVWNMPDGEVVELEDVAKSSLRNKALARYSRASRKVRNNKGKLAATGGAIGGAAGGGGLMYGYDRLSGGRNERGRYRSRMENDPEFRESERRAVEGVGKAATALPVQGSQEVAPTVPAGAHVSRENDLSTTRTRPGRRADGQLRRYRRGTGRGQRIGKSDGFHGGVELTPALSHTGSFNAVYGQR